MCTLAFAFRRLPVDTAPVCIHGNTPEGRQRATDARETDDNISLLCFHLATYLDLRPGHWIKDNHQVSIDGCGAPRHLLDHVSLTGRMSGQLLWAWLAWLIQRKTTIEHQPQWHRGTKHQPPACRDWPGEIPSNKTPPVYGSWLTIGQGADTRYSVIAVNIIRTSLFIRYKLLRNTTKSPSDYWLNKYKMIL